MRRRTSLIIAALLIVSSVVVAARARQDERKVVEDFITTRGVTFEEPKTKPQRPPRRRPAPPQQRVGRKSDSEVAKKKGETKATGDEASANVAATDEESPASKTGSGEEEERNEAKVVKASGATKERPLGLGFTLYKRQGNDLMAVAPESEFRAGDRIRIALETSADAYLYIFHAENGRNPQMIFPNPQIDDGENLIAAHTRDFIPADLETWFEFDQVAATETLYIAVSREPLAGVPAGDDLLKFCAGAHDNCYWKPSPALFEKLKMAARDNRVREGRNSQLAKLQVASPGAGLTRGIKVKREEPAPSVVRVNGSTEAPLLVTAIDLIHK